MPCRKVSYLHWHTAYFLLVNFCDIAWHSMSKPRMCKERNDIVSAFTQRCRILLEISIKPCSVLSNFYEKDLIDRFSRRMWIGEAIGILTEWKMADNFFDSCREGKSFYYDIEITFGRIICFGRRLNHNSN